MNHRLVEQLQKIDLTKKLREEITYIKALNGFPYGYFDETPDEIVIYTLGGEPLGKYIKRDNLTTTMSGSIVGSGNTLINFLHRT